MNTLNDQESPSKRRRIDNTDHAGVLISSPNSVYAHRKSLAGRATLSNAADSAHFSKSSALVYHFLDMYDIVEDQAGRLMSCTFKCGICRGGGWRWSKGGRARGSTTNMNHHMQDKHGPIWRSAQLADDSARGTPVTLNSDHNVLSVTPSDDAPKFNVDEFYRLLTRWIVTSNQPLAEIESEGFQDVLLYLEPTLRARFVKAPALQDLIFAHARSMREQTKTYLSSLPGAIAITCDVWPSANRIAFLAIIGSWITHDWRREETLLDFVELQGAYNGQNLEDAVASAITELGISNKITALVRDHAFNDGVPVRHPVERPSAPDLLRNENKGNIRSLDHIIHSSVMSLLLGIRAVPQSTDVRNFTPGDHRLTSEEAEVLTTPNNWEYAEDDDQDLPNIDPSIDLSSPVDKIRNIAKFVRSTPQRMEVFNTVAAQIEEDNEQQAMVENREHSKKCVKNLVIDVPSRWNSVYLMLERALEFSEAVDALTSHTQVRVCHKYALSQSDWQVVSQVYRWLKFFREASSRIASKEYPALGHLLRIYYVIISYVSRLADDPKVKDSPLLPAGIQACKSKLLEFFDRSTLGSEHYYFATILDPRYKDALFESNKSLWAEPFSNEWLGDCATLFKNTCEEFYNNPKGVSEPQASLETLLEEDLDDFERAWRALFPPQTFHGAPPSCAADEILLYLSEPLTAMAPLEWWRQNAERFPRLAAMARDFLCIPGTSVGVERVLSMGRDTISLKRGSLTPEAMRVSMTYRAGILLEKSSLHAPA